MTIDSSTAAASDRTLVIDRIFNAPPQIVFSVWTRAEHLARWFGPEDFTLPHCEIDFRVGGSYRFCMRSPEGEDHWVWGEYREIVTGERIVMTWNREHPDGEIWSTTIVELSFREAGGKTAFRLHQSLFETVPYRDEHGFGWGQALDRLNRLLEDLN